MPTRLAAALPIVIAAALLAGCGGSSSTDSTATTTGVIQYEAEPVPDASGPGAPAGAAARSCETEAVDAEALRATGLACERARQVMFGWQRDGGCALPAGASRGACGVRSYRCLATATARGTAVSCSRPGESLAFVAVRR